MAKQELLASIRDRYRESSRKDKSKILDEFIAVTGHHRKHGIRVLAQSEGGDAPPGGVHRAPRSSGPGPRGENPGTVGQRGHP